MKPAKARSPQRGGRRDLGIRISSRLGLLLRLVAASASATFGRLGIGVVEARVLCFTAEGATTAAAISRLSGQDQASTTRAVARLVSAGLMTTCRSGRTLKLRLTEDGERMRTCAQLLWNERDRRLTQGLSQHDRLRLIGYLERLQLNMPALAALVDEMGEG
jgi:DNA-binding MarR family transcriptional regulator